MVNYRSGDMFAPQLDISEALKVELQHFVECVENGVTPITGGLAGLQVVRILESASQSMRQRGKLMELDPDYLGVPAGVA
jgi:predicted dehydrogenase